MSGRVEGGAIRFEARLAVQVDGTVSSDGERLRVQGASEATLLLARATNFVNFRDVSGCTKRCMTILSPHLLSPTLDPERSTTSTPETPSKDSISSRQMPAGIGVS